MKSSDKIIVKHIKTPAGGMIVGSFGDKLCLCDWEDISASKMLLRRDRLDARIKKHLNVEMEEGDSLVIAQTIRELEEYFAHERTTFDIPLLFAGTEFQKKVWQMLLTIPFGQTMTYGELAAGLGCPRSVRAVANANGANAISILTPCHRVIGSDGSLTGYAGGLDAKKLLLQLESSLE